MAALFKIGFSVFFKFFQVEYFANSKLHFKKFMTFVFKNMSFLNQYISLIMSRILLSQRLRRRQKNTLQKSRRI